ncbi:MAG: hypothetical protein ABIS14_05765 [Sphingomonas sp.]
MTNQAPPPPTVAEPAGIDADPDDYLHAFALVPGRARADGWTAERQRGFIAALRVCGVVASAARRVGMTAVTAYRLRRRPGAEGFAEAWDRALDEARTDAFQLAMDRAVGGYTSARFYNGRFVGAAHRFDNRMAIAALRYADRAAPAKGYK